MAVTVARRAAHQLHRDLSHRQRHGDDPLSAEQIDRIVLQAALDGCDYDEIQARLHAARQTAVQIETFTYPGTGTVHAVAGEQTLCGAAWVAGFRAQHPCWTQLFNATGSPDDVTCRSCRRHMEDVS